MLFKHCFKDTIFVFRVFNLFYNIYFTINFWKRMKTKILSVLFLLSVLIAACKKDDGPNEVGEGKITSQEYINDLLFVDRADFKIQTDQPATFSSNDQYIQISADGVIKRLTSGEVAAITITWTNSPGNTSTFYALGATDDSFDEPYASYHEIQATDPANSYKKGWETLRKLPVSGETYALMLRHADADVGADLKNKPSQPANWWKSTDPKLARQLNEPGKQRSAELGVIFKDLQYPVSRIISSEFYRSVETAELMNLGPAISTDARINHPTYNLTGQGLFKGTLAIINEQPVDNKMTLVVGHHPSNETGAAGYPTFPNVSPFTWTGGYFVKVATDKTLTYEGAVSFAMFKYWRDKKMNKL